MEGNIETQGVSLLDEGQHSGNLDIPEIRMITATFKESESEKKE